MTAHPLLLATALSITAATPAARADDTVLAVPLSPTTTAVPLTPQQQFSQALGDHPGLVRLSPAAGIDAVCDEYLHKRFGIKTIVLRTEDKEVTRLACEHNDRKRRELAKAVGHKEWRRALNHAVVEAARRDIKPGPLRLIVQETPPPEDADYWRLLRAHYGIRMIQPTGDALPGEYDVELYNMVMRAEIERRFGRGVLAKTPRESRSRWHRQTAHTKAK